MQEKLKRAIQESRINEPLKAQAQAFVNVVEQAASLMAAWDKGEHRECMSSLERLINVALPLCPQISEALAIQEEAGRLAQIYEEQEVSGEAAIFLMQSLWEFVRNPAYGRA